MRNGILGVLGEIVVQVLSKEELEDSAKKLRDQMLDHLEVSLLLRCRILGYIFPGKFSESWNFVVIPGVLSI